MTISWPLSREQVLDDSGRPLLIPRVNFYAAGTTTPLTVYRDAARTVPWPQPVEADGFGRFPRVFLPDGQYREEMLGPYGDLLWNDDGLGIPVVDDATDPATPPDPTAVATTGDVKWRLDASIQPGWVRMNARTIGAANSGASELAAAAAKPLFVYLWSTFPDAIASVVGGRGLSAAEDFSAGKQITIPTMQGFAAIGLDDMGSTASGRLQAVVQIALTAGSTVANVSDGTRIAIGMTVVADGVPASTTVVARTGNTITMSLPAGTGATGTVTARISFFPDAQTPGQAGGDCIEALAVSQLPPSLPGSEITVDYPGQSYVRYANLISVSTGAGGTPAANVWQATQSEIATPSHGPETYPIAIDNPGGGLPHSTLQPSRLGTFYMKI